MHWSTELKGQKSRSHGYENRHGRTVASDAYCYGRVLLLPAWVCMSIRLPMFSSYNTWQLLPEPTWYSVSRLFSIYRPVFIVTYYIRFVNYSIHFDVLFIFVDWDYTLHSDFFSRLFTHAGCVAAGVGRAFSRVCLSVCLYVSLHSKRKRLELSAPKSIDI